MEYPLLHRRESLIISTIEIINEVGIQNLSTKLIAKREGVSEGTLFRHFRNKTEIILACINHFSQFDDAIIETTINKELKPIDTIKYLIRTFAEYYENYPAITAIAQDYDILMCDPELAESIRTIINKRSNFIIENIEKAKSSGDIKRVIDSKLLCNLILGGFRDLCLRWRMDKYNFVVKDKTVKMLDMIFDLITNG